MFGICYVERLDISTIDNSQVHKIVPTYSPIFGHQEKRPGWDCSAQKYAAWTAGLTNFNDQIRATSSERAKHDGLMAVSHNHAADL